MSGDETILGFLAALVVILVAGGLLSLLFKVIPENPWMLLFIPAAGIIFFLARKSKPPIDPPGKPQPPAPRDDHDEKRQ